MAHKQGAGSSKNNRDSKSKRLGIKRQKGQLVNLGNILVRQRGLRFLNKFNVYNTKDNTLLSAKKGFIKVLSRNNISIIDYFERYPNWE
jgi:large subunit ribosomal protein L27